MTEQTSTVRRRRGTVYCWEDDLDTRELYEVVLGSHGIAVVNAYPKHVADQLRSAPPVPVFGVILDGNDGSCFEEHERLRDIRYHGRILVITGSRAVFNDAQKREIPAIMKPFEFEELLRAMGIAGSGLN